MTSKPGSLALPAALAVPYLAAPYLAGPAV
jgi:hypothetical protein